MYIYSNYFYTKIKAVLLFKSLANRLKTSFYEKIPNKCIITKIKDLIRL